jgi:hypothetical protein
MKSLFTIGNPKTEKSVGWGYLTAVLHLAPYIASGYNVCAFAKMAKCHDPCLNTSGRGGIAKGNATFETPAGELPDNAIQHCRIERTKLYFEDRPEFMRRLYRDVIAFLRKCKRENLKPAIRLNGTSDLLWEKEPFPVSDNKRGIHMIYTNIFAAFPQIQFYDYSKIAKRFYREMPDNYYLCLSYSQASRKYADMCLMAREETGCSLVMVTRKGDAPSELFSIDDDFVNGDLHDLRFLDKPGSLVLLKAKGKARTDTSGFVID